MKRSTVFMMAVVVTLILALPSTVSAQGPEQDDSVDPATLPDFVRDDEDLPDQGGADQSAGVEASDIGINALVGTSFDYQGRLLVSGSPANDNFDFQFQLYDAAVGGNQIGGTLTELNVSVSDGYYSTSLDFGASAFQGEARWLEISVRPAGGGAYTLLTPRDELRGVPYALALELPHTSVANAATVFEVQNQSTASSVRAIYGVVTPTSPGGFSTGVRGHNNGTSGLGIGVWGSQDGSGWGVYGTVPDGRAGYFLASDSSATNYGVYGRSFSSNGIGVFGLHDASTGTAPGVYGETDSTSGSAVGVLGVVDPSSPGGFSAAVRGRNDGTDGLGIGVWGSQDGSGWGGYFTTVSGRGVYGRATNSAGFAGYFSGKVHVFGTLSKTAGAFKIDHPQDPENMYLQHSFVESPDMLNIYNGNVILDAMGEAEVELPSYFEDLNSDFRYQLTAVGAPCPGIYIAEEIKNNHFKIAGCDPGVKVSWQVTGIRQDAYAKAHPVEVEQMKPADERGTYLHPLEHGMPESKGLNFADQEGQQ